MALITILSREYIAGNSFGVPDRVKIGVSGANAVLIQSNPNALNIFWSIYFGATNYIMNVNSLYYNSTVPPYNILWSITQEGANWFIYFIVNTYTYTSFISYEGWTALDFPYVIAPVDPNYIYMTYKADSWSPVYNPVVYKFYSPKYSEIGYRYVVDVKTNTNTLIARLKIVPLPDGSGYVDISKILSNYVTYDFNEFQFDDNCNNSYFNYNLEVGEEYLTDWDYNTMLKYGDTSSQWNGYVILNQVNTSITHNYIVGDQITIAMSGTGSTASDITSVNGLHDVVAVPNNYQVVIDVRYTRVDPAIAVGGSTRYSDSRKTGYYNLSTTSSSVWNGVMSWKEWKDYQVSDYQLINLNKSHKLLSSFKIKSDRDNYMMRLDQVYYFNYLAKDNITDYYLNVIDNFNNFANKRLRVDGSYGYIRQFKFSYDELVNWGLSPNMTSVSFFIMNGNSKPYTDTYLVKWDRRCAIENNYVYFMDKLGSILSIPFTLRSKESIDVERDTFNKQKYYNNRSSLDLKEGGDEITHISSKKTYELSTDWMNDEQMELFEIMMESPSTWFKLDGVMYSCILEDKSLEIEKQRNKRLMRKTIKLYISNVNLTNT